MPLVPRWALLAGLGLAFAGTAYAPSASAQHVGVFLDVGVAPPPPHHEMLPPPRPGWVWAPGYWRWDPYLRHHVWVSGHWLHARMGYRWHPAHWVPYGPRYRFVAGYWGR